MLLTSGKIIFLTTAEIVIIVHVLFFVECGSTHNQSHDCCWSTQAKVPLSQCEEICFIVPGLSFERWP